MARPQALLDFLTDPMFLLTPAGDVAMANAAARRFFSGEVPDRLTDSVEEREAFARYLRRCSGTGSPLVGALVLGGTAGPVKFRTYGARLPGEPETRIALRCVASSDDEFSLLARQVRDLNSELRERIRIQAELEEALAYNQLLLRELHHRVKNNIQLLLGLFSAAQRETDSPELSAFIAGVRQRLLAIGSAQQLLYQSGALRTVEAGTLVRSLCNAIGGLLGSAASVEVAADEGEISGEIAFPLALILNELVTNAVKHGVRKGPPRVFVRLNRTGDDFTLIVDDDGPGFTPAVSERRSSGLGLVAGLCRQIGGSFSVENCDGARCIVRFSAGG